MTTAVDKWPASARLFGGRYGGPLTHRSYTTPWGTTPDRLKDPYSKSVWPSQRRATSLVPERTADRTAPDYQRPRHLITLSPAIAPLPV